MHNAVAKRGRHRGACTADRHNCVGKSPARTTSWDDPHPDGTKAKFGGALWGIHSRHQCSCFTRRRPLIARRHCGSSSKPRYRNDFHTRRCLPLPSRESTANSAGSRYQMSPLPDPLPVVSFHFTIKTNITPSARPSRRSTSSAAYDLLDRMYTSSPFCTTKNVACASSSLVGSTSSNSKSRRSLGMTLLISSSARFRPIQTCAPPPNCRPACQPPSMFHLHLGPI